MKEVWKIIPNWPAYEASSLGRLRRADSRHVLKLSVNLKGYKIVGLSKSGKRSTVTVAKAVALFNRISATDLVRLMEQP